eukprot:3391320-Rhodomonas_salina.1
MGLCQVVARALLRWEEGAEGPDQDWVLKLAVTSPITLRARYAMSPISLRTPDMPCSCYALGRPCPVHAVRYCASIWCYANYSTELACGAICRRAAALAVGGAEVPAAAVPH